MPENEFANRTVFGLTNLLEARPELREVLPLAALLDDGVRWGV